jgi:CCR4-NOT transcriptional regulation complex NOT5 subunit
MKKSAVDYLFEKLWGIHKDKFTWQMILKEAKEKEKRQIIDAYDEGIFEGGDYGYYDSNLKKGSADLYYNETYGDK